MTRQWVSGEPEVNDHATVRARLGKHVLTWAAETCR